MTFTEDSDQSKEAEVWPASDASVVTETSPSERGLFYLTSERISALNFVDLCMKDNWKKNNNKKMFDIMDWQSVWNV